MEEEQDLKFFEKLLQMKTSEALPLLLDKITEDFEKITINNNSNLEIFYSSKYNRGNLGTGGYRHSN